ncbi:MAG: glycosyltransferase [Faecousia sp.]
MEKIKVLIIAASLKTGGAEKVTRDIALYASTERYEFHYVVYGNEIGAYESQLLDRGCQIFHIPKPAESYSQYLHTLWKLIKKNKYHVVHAHNMFNCGLSMLAAACAGVPVRIAHSHSALKDGNRFVKQAYERIMRFLILYCATDLVACGVAAGQRLFGEKAFAQRGTLILNGIDVPSFAYDAGKRKAIRGQLNAHSRFILGHAGHLAEVKNQPFLLELMPLVLEKRPDALLLLLGDGEDRPALEEKIREMRLEDHVVMTGNVSNVADYLSAMDVFVFPSLYEGLPLSILEVQANGLPCVISDGVPKDVFLTDLLHPLSLRAPKQQWVDAIFSASRDDPAAYNRQLQCSDYAVETAMEKIYQIYEKG